MRSISVRHVSDDGRLLHPLSVQGIYRLAESSAADLEAILAGPPAHRSRCPGHAGTSPCPQAWTPSSDPQPQYHIAGAAAGPRVGCFPGCTCLVRFGYEENADARA